MSDYQAGQVDFQVIITRTPDGREWYSVELQYPFDKQLDENGNYGKFVESIVGTCEEYIPLVEIDPTESVAV